MEGIESAGDLTKATNETFLRNDVFGVTLDYKIAGEGFGALETPQPEEQTGI